MAWIYVMGKNGIGLNTKASAVVTVVRDNKACSVQSYHC